MRRVKNSLRKMRRKEDSAGWAPGWLCPIFLAASSLGLLYRSWNVHGDVVLPPCLCSSWSFPRKARRSRAGYSGFEQDGGVPDAARSPWREGKGRGDPDWHFICIVLSGSPHSPGKLDTLVFFFYQWGKEALRSWPVDGMLCFVGII